MSNGVIAAASSAAHQDPDATVAAIRSSGRLRMGMGLVPTFATRDSSSGEMRGIAIELGRAIADQLGVELVPVPYPSPANIPDGLKGGDWDIGILSIDPAREAMMDFSVPYAQVDSTFLAAPGSAHRTLSDFDKSGVRIVATRNSVEDLTLTRLIKHAEIVRVASVGEAFATLKEGKADSQAIPRPVAITFSRQLTGSSVCEDSYAVALHAIAVPKGRTGLLNHINEFLRGAKMSGFVQQAMDRVGLRGAQVAPD